MTTATTATERKRVSRLRRTISQVILVILAVGLVLWALANVDIDAFVDGTAGAGPLPFFAALAVLPALGFPTTPLFLLAGAAFGAPLALLGSVASMTVNLGLTYWLARGYLRRTIEAMLLVRFRYSLPNLSRVGAWRFTVLVKLAPGVPTFVKNYLIGIAGVPARIYFAVLWPLTMLYAAGVILLGDSLYDRDHMMTIIAGVVLVLLIVGLKFLRHYWRRRNVRGDFEPDPLLDAAEDDDDDERLDAIFDARSRADDAQGEFDWPLDDDDDPTEQPRPDETHPRAAADSATPPAPPEDEPRP